MDSRAFGAFALLAIAGAAPPSYDQRQEGTVNVQIDVKDLQILAFVDSDVLDDYVSYDYPYDYADFTIKPRPTPGKPSNNDTSSSTTQDSWSSWPTHPPSSTPPPVISSTTTSSTKYIQTSTTSQEFIPETVFVAVEAENHQAATSTSSQEATRPVRPNKRVDVAEPRKRCPAGFHLKSGRCFKRRLSFISPRIGMMKLVPGLLNKSKVLKSNLTSEGA